MIIVIQIYIVIDMIIVIVVWYLYFIRESVSQSTLAKQAARLGMLAGSSTVLNMVSYTVLIIIIISPLYSINYHYKKSIQYQLSL